MEELRKKKVPFNEDIEIGMMIEVPSAAILADVFAKEVDFFSIGTNDLIQYAMAADRGNEKVAHLYDPYNLSILRLIKNVIDAAHREGIWVGMCGEMAGDPLSTLILIGLGLDELSIGGLALAEVKQVIRSIMIKDAKEIADHVLNIEDPEEMKETIELKYKERFGTSFGAKFPY
jgi:phosphotransferase system enzyme I (PtsI)